MEKEEIEKYFIPQAQVDVMLEGIRGDFKVFGEGLDDVRRDVKKLKETVGLILEDIDSLKSDNVDIKRDIKDIKADIKDMKAELGMKASKETTDNHETRIASLEKVALVG